MNCASDRSPEVRQPPGPDAADAKRAQPNPHAPNDARARAIVGAVLAGGQGRRLGRGKAGLRLPASAPGRSGPTLVEWAVARLAAVAAVSEVVIAAGEGSQDIRPPEEHRIPVTVHADGPGAGPAAGVLGAARARPGHSLLVLACDLPLVPTELLAGLAASGAELAAAAADPRDPGSMNPTCALWTPPALERLAERAEHGDYRLYPLTRCADLHVEPTGAGRFGRPEDILLNVNTARDWNRALRLWRR